MRMKRKTEKAKEKDSKSDAVFMGLTVALSVVIAVVLFMLTPFFISSLFGRVIKSPMTLAVMEGLIRIAIFFIYIVAISQMKDIQRVFMYHGAEHKTINCIEHGAELTPENAAKYSRLHKTMRNKFSADRYGGQYHLFYVYPCGQHGTEDCTPCHSCSGDCRCFL